jgi:hypothetical protein
VTWVVFDAPSGAAGDMTLGALVDLGVPLDVLRDGLRTLPFEGWSLRAERVRRSSIAATQVHVDIAAAHGTAHDHRHPADILRLLKKGKLTDRARDWASATFLRLAQAEAAVHGMPIGEVHFHEVGAVDAIVDIAGACIGLDWLCHEQGIRGLRVSQLRVGRGTVRTQHGRMPVPPPAVLRLLEGFAIEWGTAEGERVTPTGAALISTLARPLGEAAIRVQRTGYGAGTMEFPDAPNVLRLLLAEPATKTAAASDLPAGIPVDQALAACSEGEHEHTHGHAHEHPHPHPHAHAHDQPTLARTRVAVLRTQIDDMIPEFYGHVMAKLFAAGALDVFYTPVQMKKDRPATSVTVIARMEDADRLAALLLDETTTLGVRIAHEERIELPRRQATITTEFGAIEVKIATRPNGKSRVVPEYESVRRAAEAAGAPLAEVYRAALAAPPPDPT